MQTIEEMKERFEKAEENNMYQFERVRALMIEGADIQEQIESKKGEVEVLKARNIEAEAPKKKNN